MLTIQINNLVFKIIRPITLTFYDKKLTTVIYMTNKCYMMTMSIDYIYTSAYSGFAYPKQICN